MTTPTAPPQGGSNTSKSISAGADVLVSLFEEEKAKIIEVALNSYRSLEAQFAKYRMQTEQMMQTMNELQGRYDAVCLELQQARFSHSEMTAPRNEPLLWQLEEIDRARKAAEKERDEIKAIAGGEISVLKDRVAALQSDIVALRSGVPDGQTQHHG